MCRYKWKQSSEEANNEIAVTVEICNFSVTVSKKMSGQSSSNHASTPKHFIMLLYMSVSVRDATYCKQKWYYSGNIVFRYSLQSQKKCTTYEVTTIHLWSSISTLLRRFLLNLRVRTFIEIPWKFAIFCHADTVQGLHYIMSCMNCCECIINH